MTALAPTTSAVSTTSIAPVLTPEQKALSAQIGTPQTWGQWFKGMFAGAWSKATAMAGKVGQVIDSARNRMQGMIGNNPAMLAAVKVAAKSMLNTPEVQAKLKLVPAEIQVELLDAAIEWTVKAPGAEEKWTALKEKYGPVVTAAVLAVGQMAVNAAVSIAVEKGAEVLSGVSSSMRVSVGGRDGFMPAVR